jgi:hypothetical protein
VPFNPARLGSSRNLLGIRDTKPRFRPGSAESEEPTLGRLSTLNGRLGPESAALEESVESAEQALRPGLDGRGMSRRPQHSEPETATPKAERRRAEPEDIRSEAPVVEFVGDSELFTPERAVPTVIDRPEEAKQIASEPAALLPALADDRGPAYPA